MVVTMAPAWGRPPDHKCSTELMPSPHSGIPNTVTVIPLIADPKKAFGQVLRDYDWKAEEQQRFFKEWEQRFGVKKSAKEIEEELIRDYRKFDGWASGWFLVKTGLLRLLMNHGDRFLSSEHCAEIAMRLCLIEQMNVNKQKEGELIVAVRATIVSGYSHPFVEEITTLTPSDQLMLRHYFPYGGTGNGKMWVLEDINKYECLGHGNLERPLFRVELPSAGTLPFQRAATLLQCYPAHNCFFGKDPMATIVFLYWLFAAGDDDALCLADGALHRRSGTRFADARRAVGAAMPGYHWINGHQDCEPR